jgi:hypothetical protein
MWEYGLFESCKCHKNYKIIASRLWGKITAMERQSLLSAVRFFARPNGSSDRAGKDQKEVNIIPLLAKPPQKQNTPVSPRSAGRQFKLNTDAEMFSKNNFDATFLVFK